MAIRQEDPFATLLAPHLDRLYRLAYRLTGTVSDAEDLLQDVLIKLYTRKTEITSIRELEPWLGRVLYNQFIDDKRRFSRSPIRLVGLDYDQVPAAQDVGHALDIQRQLDLALRQLSEEHRTVVLLHDVEGYKLEEIQEVTDTPVGTLKSRLHRARARLRELLKKDGTISAADACSPVDGVRIDAL